MQNFHLFLVMGLLVWSCYSFIGFAIVGPFTTSAFKCLPKSGIINDVPFAIIRVYQNSQSPPGIDPNALKTLTNALTAGYGIDIYMEICRGINATSQINLVNTEIVAPIVTVMDNNGVFASDAYIFIKVEPSSNPECSWEGYSQSDNCNFLKEAAGAVVNWNNVWTPCIFSTARIWRQFFGSSCDTFATDTNAPLWYANYDSTGQVHSV